LETVPDLAAVARVHGFDEADEAAAREKLGDGFPKLIFHRIVCVGALIAERFNAGWVVRSLGAPNLSERTEADSIQSFVDRIAEYRPQLVTFNGASFDLPVLRYRAMIHRVTAPGLSARSYWHRFTDDALDLCDVLACYTAGGKISLNDLCRALGFPGKLDGMDWGRGGRICAGGPGCRGLGLLRDRCGEHVSGLVAVRAFPGRADSRRV
jgi:predicted PolB exonuclease-like 3'-5' exonuclease